VLVVLMVLPGLALFYGGLVRAKNMLSVLMQVMVVFSLICVLWAIYGYSLAFGGEGPDHRRASTSLFLAGITPTASRTPSARTSRSPSTSSSPSRRRSRASPAR
jgi:ammonium transporter, Amt family